MKDITIIIPLHQLNDDTDNALLKNALENVKKCQTNYDHKLITMVVGPEEVINKLPNEYDICKIINGGDTDFCSQVNLAAKNVTTEHFSILEYDDEYNEKWFSMAQKYYYTNESVSVFLPINIQILSKEGYRQFNNEVVWAMEFSKELGYIDHNCLKTNYGFNITGGIFNTSDFVRIGGLKPSIMVAFNYEFLLRVTKKNLKVFVVPKEGYKHVIDRDNSLTDICSEKYSQEEVDRWYAMAQQECDYEEDRKCCIEVSSK